MKSWQWIEMRQQSRTFSARVPKYVAYRCRATPGKHQPVARCLFGTSLRRKQVSKDSLPGHRCLVSVLIEHVGVRFGTVGDHLPMPSLDTIRCHHPVSSSGSDLFLEQRRQHDGSRASMLDHHSSFSCRDRTTRWSRSNAVRCGIRTACAVSSNAVRCGSGEQVSAPER